MPNYKLKDEQLLGQPTAGRVRAAYKNSHLGDRDVLKELFPSAFELADLSIEVKEIAAGIHTVDGVSSHSVMFPRSGGKYAGKGFYLSDTYEWRIGVDDQGSQVLIPTRKPF